MKITAGILNIEYAPGNNNAAIIPKDYNSEFKPQKKVELNWTKWPLEKLDVEANMPKSPNANFHTKVSIGESIIYMAQLEHSCDEVQ